MDAGAAEELFNHQNNLEDEDLIKCAEEVGRNAPQFENDFLSDEYRNRVLSDRRSGVRSGVRGTSNQRKAVSQTDGSGEHSQGN